MPVWPLTLPQNPERDGYTDTVPSNLLRSEMSAGPAKVRRSGASKPHVVTATYVMASEEIAEFDTFMSGTLAGGVICFDWPHPTLGRSVRARIVPGQDGLYSKQMWGQTLAWQVSLTLEYWPDAPLS